MYYLNKTMHCSFEEAESKIRASLKDIGFGILTEIDMQATMQNKLGKDIGKYKILGACNPDFAYHAIQVERKIGIMLPCNVTVIENENGSIDVSVMDPVVALGIVGNAAVDPYAQEVKDLIQKALKNI